MRRGGGGVGWLTGGAGVGDFFYFIIFFGVGGGGARLSGFCLQIIQF